MNTNPTLEPYIHFNGQCDAAIEFYKKALGLEVVMLMRFKDNPNPAMNPPGSAEKVMHATVKIGKNTFYMSDGCSDKPNFDGFTLALTVASASEAKAVFNALAEGGKITVPLDKTFFSAAFGMATDRFGVPWMVKV
jgi:PhnB protein